MSFNTSNFTKNNTPPLAAKIGNTLLVIGTVGTAIVGLPLVLPATIIATIPTAVFTFGGWAMAAGIVGKAVSKMFGKKEQLIP